MKRVGGDGDHHQMHKNHHPHHHRYHHHHQIPQDFSLEYSLSGTSSPEAVLSAVDKKKSLEDKTKKKKKKQQQQQQILNGRRAALEQDVAQLQTQLQNEKTLRMGLERALEEASDPTTLSPQPSELITEIVALQNEVSHLEQHVLSLYRKVLDQRLLSSQQQQYGGTTTVMTDQLRLSSSSSSEAQVPLPPLPLPPASPSTTICQLLQSQASPKLRMKTNPKPARSSSSTSHVKVDTKLGTAKKASPDVVVIGLDPSSSRTPNALSEELLCCMAAIYCKLADPPLPTELSNSLSPSYSSSSSSATATTTTTTTMHESSSRDDNDVGPYSSMVEVPWICVDKERLTYAARALRNFRLMVEQLEKVDPGKMTQDEKLAFWINVYNALMMHAYLAYGIPRNRLKRLSLLQKAAYKVGLYSISAQTIEHSILGFRSNRPAQWLQALLNPGTKFKSGDERWAYALQTHEPSVCFALCCGGCSDPAVRVYTAKNVRLELEVAKREFLQASVGIRGDSKVLLPKILDWYSRELMINSATLLEWVCQNVPGKLEARIRQCIEVKQLYNKSSAHCIQWSPYSFGFRYIFVQSLARRYSLSMKEAGS
ncbi:unnamed protein product [Sphagnum balticum]